jgi:hypothetical protein
MTDAINSGNPVNTTKFIVNKYHDIDGSRANQETPRGRLAFRDTNGRMTLPRTITEAKKAVFPVDWPKPLNPPPYFDGPGLNGATLYPFSDGSLDASETEFALDPDAAFSTPWPAAIKQYDVPPMFYDLPVASGNKVLVFDEGTFTYGSGNYTGVSSDYNYGSVVFADYTSGNEGKITASGAAAGNTVVGTVVGKDIFGQNTLTVKLRGAAALTS